MRSSIILPTIAILSMILNTADSHVIFIEPPSRPTIGKLRPQCNLAWNVDMSGLYCGGLAVQHNNINNYYMYLNLPYGQKQSLKHRIVKLKLIVYYSCWMMILNTNFRGNDESNDQFAENMDQGQVRDPCLEGK